MLFFTPFMTTIQTRYHSLNKVIVYFITFIIPVFLISILQNYPNSLTNPLFYVVFLLALVSFVNIYEIGYIYNETETIKKEKNPTKRLTDRQIDFYENRKVLIYVWRIVLSAIINGGLYFLISAKSLIMFSCAEVLTLGVFLFYNMIRGKFTQLIYLFLSVLKYTTIVFCWSETLSFSVILACIFVFPLVRTCEYKAHYTGETGANLFFRKYIIKYDVSKIPIFRVIATGILLLLSLIFKIAGICNWIPFIACAYIFLYRLFLFITVKMGAHYKGYLQEDKKQN